MRNIKDRQVQYPNRFQLTPVSGQENVYDLTAVPGTITQAGTALNKANLLSDSTATLLGLSGDPTVNDALSGIGAKLKAGPKWYLLGDMTTSASTQGVSMSLSDSLKNYKALYFYSANMVNSGSTARGAYCYLGNAATGDYVAYLRSNKTGSTGYETWVLLPIIPITTAQGGLFNLSKYTATGSEEINCYHLSTLTEADWDCRNLYFVVKDASGNILSLSSGATIKVWGLA